MRLLVADARRLTLIDVCLGPLYAFDRIVGVSGDPKILLGGRQAGFSCTMIPAPTADNGALISLGMTGELVSSNGQ